MTVPDPACVAVREVPKDFSIRLLGGAKIIALPQVTDGVLTELDQVMSLLTQLGPGLAAAQPIFNVINAIQSIFDLITSVVTADPAGIIEAVQKASDAIAGLAASTPEVAIPLMIADSIQLIVAILEAVLDAIDDLVTIDQQAQALLDQAIADGNAALQVVAQCQKDQASAMAQHLCKSLGPVGQMIGVLQALLDLIPGSVPIPGIPDCSGLSLSAFKAAIQGSVDEIKDSPIFERPPVDPPVIAPGALETKAGTVLPAGFSGTPLRTIVIFNQRLPTDDYTISLGFITTGDAAYDGVIESMTSAGFVINLGTVQTSGLTAVDWQAIPVQN